MNVFSKYGFNHDNIDIWFWLYRKTSFLFSLPNQFRERYLRDAQFINLEN